MLTLYTTPVVYLYLDRLRLCARSPRRAGTARTESRRGHGMIHGAHSPRSHGALHDDALRALAGAATASCGWRAPWPAAPATRPSPSSRRRGPRCRSAVAPVEQKTMPAPDPGHRHRRGLRGGLGARPGRRRAAARAHQGRPGRAQGRRALHHRPPRPTRRRSPRPRPTSRGTRARCSRRAPCWSAIVSRVAQTRAALARDQAQAKNAQVQASGTPSSCKRELIAQEQYDQFRTTAESLAATVQRRRGGRAERGGDRARRRGRHPERRADRARRRGGGRRTRRSSSATRRSARPSTAARAASCSTRATSSGPGAPATRPCSSSTRCSRSTSRSRCPSSSCPRSSATWRRARSRSARCPPATHSRPRGVVTFVDNAVDPTTGTIRLKATFPNEEKQALARPVRQRRRSRWPVEPDAIVVPSRRCRAGQQGAYVFVVKADSTVESRRVTVARTQGSETVIAKGLQAGEKVVTDGQPRLTQGAKIEIRTAGGPGGAAGGGGRAGQPGGTPRVAEGRGQPAPSVRPAPEHRLAPSSVLRRMQLAARRSRGREAARRRAAPHTLRRAAISSRGCIPRSAYCGPRMRGASRVRRQVNEMASRQKLRRADRIPWT